MPPPTTTRRVEESIDRFRRRQQAEAAVNDRIKDTGSVYAAWTRFKRHAQAVHRCRRRRLVRARSPGYDERYYKARDDLDKAVVAAGFADLADFEAACNDWLLLFRVARGRAHASRPEGQRAGRERRADPLPEPGRGQRAAFQDRRRCGGWTPRRTTPCAAPMPTMTQVYASGQTPRTPEQIAADKEYQEKSAQAEAERTKLAGGLSDPQRPALATRTR